jgi:2-hydroxychromene-2-carboxylate isomerase
VVDAPSFYYDFNSPYAYLAAARVDALLPLTADWEPIALAFVHRARNRTPWSMHDDTRDPGMRDCERRASDYGLPPMRWPPGWPVQSYSLTPLRAAYVAAEHGLLKPFSAAAFARNFVGGEGLAELDDVVAAAAEVGLAEGAVRDGVQRPDIKAAVTAATDAAIARGVVGVPTVAAGGALFWGDDQLEAAVSALGSAG